MVPLGLGDIVQLVFRGIQRAGGHFVQQRLPEVGEVGIDQRDLRLAALAQRTPQARSQLQTTRSAANHNDAMAHGRSSM